MILTRGAFLNALRVAAAVGGSSNYILHLPAIASELGIELTLQDIGTVNQTTPLLCRIAPNGPDSVVDLDRAGGVPALMKELQPLLDMDVMTVTGKSLGDNLVGVPDGDRSVIRSRSDPMEQEGGIVILTGNLAPQGAVVKRSAVPKELYRYSGPARIFRSEEDCIAAIQADKVREGDVLVVAYEGPKGGPGMREMHRLTGVLRAFSDNIALVTDGRFSGADSGLVIGYATPEAADGGPIGVVREGDIIEIDLTANTIRLDISDDEISRRVAGLVSQEGENLSPLLQRYRRLVGSAAHGAVWRL
jgi:dihydroxy-acid dehydratase